jgi:hypothetical protein
MTKPLVPGTLCILIYTPSGADVGRIVEIVSFVGRKQLGPEVMPEAYLTRCAAGRPLHSVRQWLADGSFRDLHNSAYRALADRSQLRPLSGLEDAEDTAAHERGPTEVTA